ncbi:MAG TPA: lipocalin-like domain-containing protein [Gammaproteobacteria bacterium]|nr:lipocalin-like domain-containing protein [Gammaproteobacteria bacterium]
MMNRLRTLTLTTLALLFLGVALPSGDAVGQQKTLKEQVVGTWTYVSVDTVHPDGSRVPLFGPNPQGIAIFDGNGRYALMTSRSGLPKFASNNRNEGTPEENKAVVQGSISHFGRYTVNEADKTITFHIETSTFPNWNGTEQKRPFTLTGDELKWTTAASSGGSAEVVLKRAK